MYILGFDIGGTKCAVITAKWENGNILLLAKDKCETDLSITPFQMIEKLISMAENIMLEKPALIGVSCGGPLDMQKGVILGPPNLSGWDNVEITKILRDHFGVPAYLQNDANACTVAEWLFGNGRGFENVVFMTFGTGLGAGMIMNGKLVYGASGNAGEIGHIRLEKEGPACYGKEGSFEGFCSGGGIAKLGYEMACKAVSNGYIPSYFKVGMEAREVTAKSIADAAYKGDKTALEVYRISGEYLGKGLAILIDILNPEAIIIGSIFSRNQGLFMAPVIEQIKKEALQSSADSCRILPSGLGESIGDYAAVAVALLGGGILC